MTLAEQHAKSCEWNSSAYHVLSGPQVSWGQKVLSRLRLCGDEIVLDAGCGTGRLTAELLTSLPQGRVVGLDLSRNMLDLAKEHLRRDVGSRLQLVAADLSQLPFVRVFDGIVSTAAFHWVLDHDELFRDLRLALVPGGWLEAQCGGGPNLAALRQRVDVLAGAPKYSAFLGDFREPWCFQEAEDAAESLHRAGFVEVETSIEPAFTVLQDEKQYVEFVRNIILMRHLQQLPDQGLRDGFMASLSERASKDDPPFSLDYWRLNLRGRAG